VNNPQLKMETRHGLLVLRVMEISIDWLWFVVVMVRFRAVLLKEVAMALLHLAMLVIPLPFPFSKLFTLFMSFQVAAIMLNGNAFWI
jgi:hypothetical protein